MIYMQALSATLESLRGLLDMHEQLAEKTQVLRVKREQAIRERDDALRRLRDREREALLPHREAWADNT